MTSLIGLIAFFSLTDSASYYEGSVQSLLVDPADLFSSAKSVLYFCHSRGLPADINFNLLSNQFTLLKFYILVAFEKC